MLVPGASKSSKRRHKNQKHQPLSFVSRTFSQITHSNAAHCRFLTLWKTDDVAAGMDSDSAFASRTQRDSATVYRLQQFFLMGFDVTDQN